MHEPGSNIILATDSYKQTQWAMHPDGMARAVSYSEARGGIFPETVFFGLQYVMKKRLEGQVVTREKIDSARKLLKGHFGADHFNIEGWEHILREHGGRLPVRIRAVPEGMSVPARNVQLTVENTDPKCAWVVHHLETLLVELWYTCTVASASATMKRTLEEALEKSADTKDKLPFMLHDFGYRGSTSVESAAIGGAAHLTNFLGTDTIAAMEMLQMYYGGGEDGAPIGLSIPAAEHSTIMAWGNGPEAETNAYRHILQQFPEGLVSVVSDTWDVFNACENIWGGSLYNHVWSGRNTGRTLVVRPDSGKPWEVVPQCLDLLEENFGSRTNSKGYKMLPDYLRMIQGDGITLPSLRTICQAVMDAGWSIENLAFGSGGGLLQKWNRDDTGTSIKLSAVMNEGSEDWESVTKNPKTDPGKASKGGYLYLKRDPEGNLYTANHENEGPEGDLLETVFLDGKILRAETLASIRARRGWSA